MPFINILKAQTCYRLGKLETWRQKKKTKATVDACGLMFANSPTLELMFKCQQ